MRIKCLSYLKLPEEYRVKLFERKDRNPVVVRVFLARYLKNAQATFSAFKGDYTKLYSSKPIAYFHITRMMLNEVAFFLNMYQSENFKIVFQAERNRVTYQFRFDHSRAKEAPTSMLFTCPTKQVSYGDADWIKLRYDRLKDNTTICPIYLPPDMIMRFLMTLLKELRADAKASVQSRAFHKQ